MSPRLYAPLVFLSTSSRKWASLWIRCSLPCFPIPKSRRVVNETRRVSRQVGPLLKMTPKERKQENRYCKRFCQEEEGRSNGLGSAGNTEGPTDHTGTNALVCREAFGVEPGFLCCSCTLLNHSLLASFTMSCIPHDRGTMPDYQEVPPASFVPPD